MKINELLSTQQEIDEGVGDLLGRAAGHVAGAAGAAGRGLKGAWQDAKAGYAAAKGSWDPKTGAPAAPGGTAPTAAPGGTAPTAAPGGTAPTATGRPYVAPAPEPARTAPGAATTAPSPGTAGNMGDIIKMIDTLDPQSKQELAGELEKNIAATPKPAAPAAPTAAPAAPTAAPAAPTAAPAAPTAAPAAPTAAKPAAASAPKGFTVPGAVTPTNIKYSGLAKPGAKPAPTQAELDADQASMATGSNESFHSNFLGKLI